MGKYGQEKRPIKVQTALGADELVLLGFVGTEGISTPFAFTLDLMSENASIDPKKLLRTAAIVKVALPSGGDRVIHGLIHRFIQLGQKETLTFYRAEIVPWLWFLTLSSECKIFQSLSVLEIIEKVFKAQGYSDFQIKCSKSYPKREYCVQYRETHFNFVSRLMEEEGIFYFFEHTAGKHTLVLADSSSGIAPCPGQARARVVESAEGLKEDVITFLVREHAVHSGKATLRDYDPLQPSLRLESSMSGKEKEEVFDYPGLFTKLDEGERYARLQVEEWEGQEQRVRGTGNCRAFQSGYRFEVADHYRKDTNQAYQLLEVSHQATAGDYTSWNSAPCDYRNEFVAMPQSLPFRPPRRAAKPVVHGSQTAVVVGKSGEDIWTDKYGRVRVQFFWDRDGKKDEKSSCWVRVASSWAGKAFGAIHIPRIGQEVIVDFLEGDPDRPIVTGRVYNAEQMPPYELPANQTQSGFKSRSAKDGAAANFNELRFEDKKGNEEVFLHAEKDLNVVVKNIRNGLIHKDDILKVEEGNHTTSIEKGDQTLAIKTGKQTVTIKGNQAITLDEGDQTLEIKKGKNTITIQGDQAITLKQGDQTLEIKMGKQTVTIQGDQQITLKQGSQVTEVKIGDLTTKVGMGNISTKASLGKCATEAMMGIEFKVGGNSIKVDQTGVTIKGMMVKVEGQVQTSIKGLMCEVKGDAMLQAKGAITMIG